MISQQMWKRERHFVLLLHLIDSMDLSHTSIKFNCIKHYYEVLKSLLNWHPKASKSCTSRGCIRKKKKRYILWIYHLFDLNIILQTCQTPIRPITPNNLLDCICWSISDSTSTASIYTDSFSVEDPSENHASIYFDAKGDGKDSEASFSNSTRPLTERLLLTPCE